MNRNDFKRKPTHPDEAPYWELKVPVASRIGDCNVTLEFSDGEDSSLDDAMVEQANQLLAFYHRYIDLISRIVFGSYLYVSRTDPDALESSGVPAGLTMDQVLSYISGRTISVSRKSSEPGAYECHINIIPDWDHEHSLIMSVSDNKITEINGYNYHFEGEELILD